MDILPQSTSLRSLLKRNELMELMGRPEGLCVSIYMPTHRAGREVQQDSIRLKDLLDQAEERLISEGLRAPEARDMLDPARDLFEDSFFWQHQSDGLAVFLSAETTRYYRLPLDFEDLVVVGDRFHVKPLLPLLSGDGRFYVLALSQQEIRLLHGTHYSVDEVNLEEVPETLTRVLRWNDPEKRLQFHTTTRTPGGEGAHPMVGGGRPAVFHGHGVASADDPKDYIARYFHRVDDGLSEVLGDESVPLVLAGVDYLHPMYREANTYPHLLDEGIERSPEELSAQELHRLAWAIVQPLFLAEREEAADAYRQLTGTGSERASEDVEEIVPAAHGGRVEALFVALDVQKWGIFDPEAYTASVHREAGPESKDLLDVAAVHTFLNGGTVYAVEAEQVPGGAAVAAVFRY